jgi:tetratricopeptide (TPR) repeat protein
VSVLESVLSEQPDHPGAAHFYIHAVEASQDPDRAVAAAEMLLERVPGAGHLVHMPSHIYVRVGRYADSADANVQAIAADRAYLEVAPEPTLYWAYYAHNLHFLAYSAMMEGRYETAITAARELERDMPEPFLREAAWLIEGIMPTTFHVMIRFGRWEEILLEPEPPEFRLVSRAVRRYARGIAMSALGRTAEAREEIKAFDAAMAEVPQEWWIFNNRVHQVLPIARAMLAGELAFREGRLDEAFATLREGVAAEDALVYDEPPGWMLPVRHALGALLMSAGRYAEAEEVYREDQLRNRGNGWSLLGLKQALEAQGRTAEAEPFAAQLATAWKRKDVKPTSSCYCEPRRS